MSTILVSIVSEQTVPNYLFIKEFQDKVDKFLFLTTEQMEQQNKTQMICDTAHIPKDCRIKTNISDDVLKQSLDKLDRLGLSPNNQYLVNLTGGTKMMSIAVWRYFHQFPNVRFFYVPIGKGVYHELFDDRPAQSNIFNYQMSVEEYLHIYGIRYECEPILFSSNEVMDVFYDVKAGGFDLDKFPRRKLRKLELPDKNKQVHTKWFEEYVYYLLVNELKLTQKQIITGVKLFEINEEKKQKFYANDNEADVLMVYQNRPYIIECKFSVGKEKINTKILTNYIYKLAAINKRFGLSAQATIFTLSDCSSLNNDARTNLERRLAITGVRPIIDRNHLLKNFSSHLKAFLK